MIVGVEPLRPLGGHPGVAHDHVGVLEDAEPEEMGREGPLVDLQTATGVVGNAGCIRTPLLAGHGEDGQDLRLLLAAQFAAVVQNSE